MTKKSYYCKIFVFSNWDLMRSGQPGVPTEDNWLVSSEGAALEKGKKRLLLYLKTVKTRYKNIPISCWKGDDKII